MPRSKKGSRKYYKSYGKKKTKFSKFNLYSHKSAKSQAKQIYDLSKKVDSVYKMTKPDIDSFVGAITPSASINFGTTSVVNYVMSTGIILDNSLFSSIGSNVDMVYIKNIKFNFLYRYNSLSGTSQPIYIRLTFLKLKTTTSTMPPVNTIFSENTDPYIRVRGPLRIGLYDSGYKVIGDYRYKITNENPNLDFKTYFKVGRFDKGLSTLPKKSIFVYIYIWNPNYTNQVNHSEGQMFCKYAYQNPSKTVGNE